MPINFSGNVLLSETGSKIYSPGRIVQTVHTEYTSQMNTTSTSPVDFFTSSTITMTNASNILVIEFHSDNRTNDWYDGNWNLYYMDLVHVQSGTQISYTGYRGELTYNIHHIHRVARHAPGSVGPHSYKVRGWSYAALNTTFNGGANWVDNDGRAYIRITEIAV
jgi:hypothetical protein